MNTNPIAPLQAYPTPAYLVYHNNQISEPTRTFLVHSDLLTARKAAMTRAEALFGSQAHFADQEEVEVYLVELALPDDPNPRTVARIFAKYTGPALPPPGVAVSPAVQQLRERSLLELEREYGYYQQHNRPDGFGCFIIRVELTHQPEPLTRLVVLFDALSYAMVLIGAYKVNGHPYPFDLEYIYPDEPVELTSRPLIN